MFVSGTNGPWRTIRKVDESIFYPGDSLLFRRGQVWRATLLSFSSSGSSSNPIMISCYGTGAMPILDGALSLVKPIFEWKLSGLGNNVYYLRLAAGGKPGISRPDLLWLDDVYMPVGSITSLSDHQWAWGDQDMLGYSTVYLCDLRGEPGATGALVEGSQAQAVLSISRKNYITIDGLQVEKGGSHGVIDVISSSYITVRNCYVREANYAMIQYRNSDNGLCEKNTVRGNRRISTPFGFGIYFYQCNNGIIRGNLVDMFVLTELTTGIDLFESNNCLVEKNRVIGPVGNCYYIRPNSNDNTIRNNYGENADMGIQIREGSNRNKVHYNVLYNVNLGIQSDGDKPITGSRIFNNTIVSATSLPNKNGININHTNKDWQVRNNIVLNTGGFTYAIKVNPASVGNGTSDYNCYQSNGVGNFTTHNDRIYSFEQWASYQLESGQDSHSIRGDPKLVNPAGKNPHLLKDSPCIDKGTNVGLTQDFDGHKVPFGNAPDIGAFEYGW